MSIHTVAKADNYVVGEVGKFSGLDKFENGKAFLGQAFGLTLEVSITKFKPGTAVPFFHDHKNHEEVYIIVSGAGEFQLNDKVVKVSEGSVVRISPGVSRNIKNTGKTDLIVICAQAERDSIKAPFTEDFIMTKTDAKFSK
ncbi:oxalate-binding protein family [Trichomonas vaginalis G3]|uniref:oxalate-binding protein family n=1 Tax=Trichomonas vaginalis (strain ATCC PRA-98 / G3) TaxID=412133 RepID=UPI0021E5922F|nr:oxalate-binding protein family [Trichomonas vaginalis G3]KAI5525125.1 oxalate-binding protein family [Trichomonas vaginalis G3]